MHEILFRAKAINRIKGREYRTKYKNGDWVFGLLTEPYREFDGYIQPATMKNTNGVDGIDVDHETLGQFTGLTDKNGARIFEGDIVTYPVGIRNYRGKVIFWCAAFCIEHFFPKNLITTLDDDAADCEVIGNIYDNPDELGGDNDD